jgi:hypothetical protein
MEPTQSSETSAFNTFSPYRLKTSLSSYTLHHLLKMEPTQSSETSAFNTQTPGKYPEGNLSLLEHGESLKTRILQILYTCTEEHTNTLYKHKTRILILYYDISCSLLAISLGQSPQTEHNNDHGPLTELALRDSFYSLLLK